MKKFESYFYALVAVTAMQACTKEPVSTIEKREPIPKHYIKTGESNHESINYTVFEPVLFVKGENLYKGDGYEHRDSLLLDVNNDGEFDLRFDYHDFYYESDCPEDSLANDSIIVDCFPDAGNSCYVRCLNEIEMLSFNAYRDQPLPIEDSVLLNNFKITVQSLNSDENEELKVGPAKDDEYYWSGKESSGILAFAGMGKDSWDSQELHYLGFRFPTSDTTAIHGWVQLSCRGTTCIEIYDMAIEK